MYATNRQDYTLTKFRFAPCNNASVPSSVLFNPPVYTYDTTGTFNINLVVNEGLPDQVNICKSIVVLERPDTLLIDTTLCYGDSCFAQGKWQTTAGIYHDTIFIAAGCDSIIITDLSFTPRIPVDLGPDTMWCDATPFLLRTGVMDAGYLWQDGSTDSTYLVSQPGRYWVIVTKYDCPARDSILISECTSPVWFPNAFTPNGDGINDIYHPVGEGVVKFSMYLFNRWGEQIFSTSAFSMGWDGAVRGQAAPDGVYFFVATYEMADKPGEAYHANGSVTLLR
jgi:gliding motility-associated-like protein